MAGQVRKKRSRAQAVRHAIRGYRFRQGKSRKSGRQYHHSQERRQNTQAALRQIIACDVCFR